MLVRRRKQKHSVEQHRTNEYECLLFAVDFWFSFISHPLFLSELCVSVCAFLHFSSSFAWLQMAMLFAMKNAFFLHISHSHTHTPPSHGILQWFGCHSSSRWYYERERERKRVGYAPTSVWIRILAINNQLLYVFHCEASVAKTDTHTHSANNSYS